MTGFTIVGLETRHRADWDRLYAGYAGFYRVAQTPEMRERVWGWIMDPAHEVEALVAEDAGGTAIGLAHYRPFARPLMAATGGFLDDLFVDPAQRGRRVADALIEAVADRAKQQDSTRLYWLTQDHNATARRLYDRVAKHSGFIRYEYPLA